MSLFSQQAQIKGISPSFVIMRQRGITEALTTDKHFEQDDTKIILLLCGGDKSTQNKDILIAKQYWQDYRRRCL